MGSRGARPPDSAVCYARPGVTRAHADPQARASSGALRHAPQPTPQEPCGLGLLSTAGAPSPSCLWTGAAASAPAPGTPSPFPVWQPQGPAEFDRVRSSLPRALVICPLPPPRPKNTVPRCSRGWALIGPLGQEPRAPRLPARALCSPAPLPRCPVLSLRCLLRSVHSAARLCVCLSFMAFSVLSP